jgi:hypothetical protein
MAVKSATFSFGSPFSKEHSSIIARRAKEDAMSSINSHAKEVSKSIHDAKWHQIAERTQARSQVKRIAGQLKHEDDVALAKRRRELALLLQNEEDSYRKELAAVQEFEGTSAGVVYAT